MTNDSPETASDQQAKSTQTASETGQQSEQTVETASKTEQPTPPVAEEDSDEQESQRDQADVAPTAEKETTAEGDGEPDSEKQHTETSEVVIVTRQPTIRPTLLRLALTLVIGTVLLVPLLTVEELLGSASLTQLGAIIVGLLLVIAVGRLLVELLVLRQTEYLVTERGVKRRYSLLGYTKTREIPYGLVRSTELEQRRLQYVFGVSTVALNQGLGDLRFPAVSDYDEFYGEIRTRVEASVTGPRQNGNRNGK